MGGRSKASGEPDQAYKLKGTAPALTMLALQTEDVDAIERQLTEQISQMPQFFLHAPVLLDLEALGGRSVSFAGLAEVLRRHHLVPVAVRNPTDEQRELAVAAGWGVLQSSLVRPSRGPVGRPSPSSARPALEEARRPEPPPPSPLTAELSLSTVTVRHAVRSGQVVYAAGGDIVVLAPVSSGAELIADGNIHVYAPLRGRALAGAHDNPDASIFCLSLDAEFLSVAGLHVTSEDIPSAQRGKPARVHVVDGKLVITTL